MLPSGRLPRQHLRETWNPPISIPSRTLSTHLRKSRETPKGIRTLSATYSVRNFEARCLRGRNRGLFLRLLSSGCSRFTRRLPKAGWTTFFLRACGLGAGAKFERSGVAVVQGRLFQISPALRKNGVHPSTRWGAGARLLGTLRGMICGASRRAEAG